MNWNLGQRTAELSQTESELSAEFLLIAKREKANAKYMYMKLAGSWDSSSGADRLYAYSR